jgi:hypothetical protein
MYKNSGSVLQMMNSVSATKSGWSMSFRGHFFLPRLIWNTHTHMRQSAEIAHATVGDTLAVVTVGV